MATALVLDPRFRNHKTGAHPECPERLDVILTAFQEIGWPVTPSVRVPSSSSRPPDGSRASSPGPMVLEPRLATREELLRVHSPAHLERLEHACLRGDPSLDPDTRICPESYTCARLAAGGALVALEAMIEGRVQNAFVAGRPPGHHATRSRAMGFCLLNTVAVAAAHAQAVFGLERILIVDWDVHHGNGTQDIFSADPNVYYVSLHQSPHYPWTGSGQDRGDGPGLGRTLNIPLRAHTSAQDYRTAFSRALETVLETFSPQLVLISAGFDGHVRDPLGSLELTDADFAWMTDRLLEVAQVHAGGRVLSVLEGGYELTSLGLAARAHVERLVAAGKMSRA